METGSIAKPLAATVPSAPRADHGASSGAVKTDLPPSAALQPVAESEAVRFEPSDGARTRAALDAALQEVIRRNIVIDPKSREVVFQTVDERSGQVMRQIPDEALLKLRAYFREMQDKDAPDGDSGNRVAKTA